jgi:hypothetical protein
MKKLLEAVLKSSGNTKDDLFKYNITAVDYYNCIKNGYLVQDKDDLQVTLLGRRFLLAASVLDSGLFYTDIESKDFDVENVLNLTANFIQENSAS